MFALAAAAFAAACGPGIGAVMLTESEDQAATRVQACVTPDAVAAGHLERIIALSPRPGVLIDERELSVLRRGLVKEGWKRSLYLQPTDDDDGGYLGAGLQSVAERWRRAEIRIPERSGHYHHFFCQCGVRLSVPEPLRVLDEYSCPACGKTCSGERFDGAIRYMQHNRLASAALALALVYAIERDKDLARKAAEILTSYARAYPGPHTSHVEGGIMFQSLCEAVWVIPLAQAYDLIHDSRALTDADRALIEDKLFRPVAEGLKHVGIGGNWGSWHLSAVGVIGIAIKDASLTQYALDSFASQIADQLGDDGLWPESVHTYHFYPLTAFVHFAEACRRAGIDIYDWEVRPGKSLKAMFKAPLQYMFPSFQLPAINDGWYWSFLPLSLYELAYRRWNDPAFAWVLKQGYRFGDAPVNSAQRDNAARFSRSSFYALLFGRDLPGRSNPPVLKTADFPVLGICALRSPDGLMATLDYGPFLGHGHLDKLGFTLYANDSVLVPDYGTPGYGSPITEWYQSTAAHNTVVVDGKSQKPAAKHGLKSLRAGAFVQIAEAEADDCYDGVSHTRRLILVGGICVVSDVLESDTEHDFDWIMRCEGAPVYDIPGPAAELDVSSYPRVSLASAARAVDGSSVTWDCENGRLQFGIWTPGAEALFGVGECPAETAARSASMVICRQRGRKARFFAALAPSGRQHQVKIVREGCVIRVAGDGWEDAVYARAADDAVSAAPLHTDGQVAAVRTAGGAVTAIALAGGTWVQWKGERVLECSAPVDCVEVTFGDRGPVVNYCGDTGGSVRIKTSARAMRVNGRRAAATRSDGHALLQITPDLLPAAAEAPSAR